MKRGVVKVGVKGNVLIKIHNENTKQVALYFLQFHLSLDSGFS